MEQLAAVMLIVGCNADAATCTEVPVPSVFYSSVAECRAELPMQMRFSASQDDRLFGACEAFDEALLDQSATIEWTVNRAGELRIEVKVEDVPPVASSPLVAETLTRPIS